MDPGGAGVVAVEEADGPPEGGAVASFAAGVGAGAPEGAASPPQAALSERPAIETRSRDTDRTACDVAVHTPRSAAKTSVSRLRDKTNRARDSVSRAIRFVTKPTHAGFRSRSRGVNCYITRRAISIPAPGFDRRPLAQRGLRW